MRFAAELLRHKALGFPWNMPAFGEEVGIVEITGQEVDQICPE